MTCIRCGGPVEGRALQCDGCRTAPRKGATSQPTPNSSQIGSSPAPARIEAPVLEPPRERLTAFRVALPWAVLVSDNARSGAGWWTTEDYRKAREDVHMLAMRAAGDLAPMLGPVAVRALVYMPDARERDVSNYIKCTHDGLAGVAYEKDRQIRDVHWTAAGIDPAEPRAEITVRAMSSVDSAA